MTILVIAVILLTFICIRLISHIYVLRKNMKAIKNELIHTRDMDYNRQITVDLVDNSLSEMVVELNNNLDYQKKLKEATEVSEQVLKQSVSDIAHDLRTPLAVISGNLQMIKREENLSQRSREYLAVSTEKCGEMKRMADDFFELSLLESDSTPVRLSTVNMTNLLMQFLADNEAVIRSNRLTPEIEFPQKSVFVLGDEQLLVRMLGNLLNNVLKYAKGSFHISLELSETECGVVFENSVEAGTEIDTERLFERTYRADKARNGKGAGLGLYIVKLLAKKQGGRVTAVFENCKLKIAVYLKTGG